MIDPASSFLWPFAYHFRKSHSVLFWIWVVLVTGLANRIVLWTTALTITTCNELTVVILSLCCYKILFYLSFNKKKNFLGLLSMLSENMNVFFWFSFGILLWDCAKSCYRATSTKTLWQQLGDFLVDPVPTACSRVYHLGYSRTLESYMALASNPTDILWNRRTTHISPAYIQKYKLS